MELQIFLPLFGVLALLFVFYKNAWVSKQDPGNEKMQIIAANIAKGAMAFLKAEYKVLSLFVVAVAALLAFKGSAEEGSSWLVALSFLVGAVCSALAGFIVMRVATKAEQTAPTRKDKATNHELPSSADPLNAKSAATATTNRESTLYSAFKNAIAPLAILAAIICIFSLPGSCFETHAFL
jgi:Na+/H+-translocating membrane pyrophosphatase